MEAEPASGQSVQRYYDPMGRFLSVDPVTADAANGKNFNRYWYGNNNPYKFTDPDGRLPRGDDGPKNFHDCVRTIGCDSTYGFGGSGDGIANKGGKVDLRNHENVNGGHTISKHVGKSDNYLLNRMNEPYGTIGPIDFYLREASSFSSLESANRLVSSTVASSETRITEWLANPFANRKPLELNKNFVSPTGRVAYRDGRGRVTTPESVKFTTGYGVRVFLKISHTSPNGYTIVTAFPTAK